SSVRSSSSTGGGGGPDGVVAVPLSGCFAYTAEVAIGSPPTRFQLVVDTGSTTLAVASGSCASCSDASPRYTPGAGAKDEHQPASDTYAGGEMWSGEVYADTVSMGTSTASASVRLVAVEDQSRFLHPPIPCGPSATPSPAQGFIGFAPGPDA